MVNISIIIYHIRVFLKRNLCIGGRGNEELEI